jgi:rhodanese-related sulfurtransferase
MMTPSQPGRQLPAAKKTSLGLYVTTQEAYDMWKANPEKVVILDVRTPEEYVLIGHPDMALNIPLFFPKYEWHEDRRRYSAEPNADFMADAQELLSPDDTILAMCRSGGRSAMAVNMLAQAGYQNVYNIFDGMEGDAVNDPESAYHGKRMRNGWKNAGLPWTYDLDPELVWHPHEDDLEKVRTALDL